MYENTSQVLLLLGFPSIILLWAVYCREVVICYKKWLWGGTQYLYMYVWLWIVHLCLLIWCYCIWCPWHVYWPSSLVVLSDHLSPFQLALTINRSLYSSTDSNQFKFESFFLWQTQVSLRYYHPFASHSWFWELYWIGGHVWCKNCYVIRIPCFECLTSLNKYKLPETCYDLWLIL